MTGVAVVFDSAGTLLHMYRAAKDLRNGIMLYDIVTTELAHADPNYGIVILLIEPDILLQIDKDQPVYKSLDEYHIKISIGCFNNPISINEALSIIHDNPEVMVSDLQDVLMAVWDRCKDKRYMGVGIMIDRVKRLIPYTLSTGGILFTGVEAVISQLKEMGVKVFIASGDKQEDVEFIAESIGVKKKHTFGHSTPYRKRDIIKELKNSCDKVVMVGDAINDVMAFREADLAVLTVQQRNVRPERLSRESDVVIDHISQILPLVRDLL
jgi:soluble P-type ATPase